MVWFIERFEKRASEKAGERKSGREERHDSYISGNKILGTRLPCMQEYNEFNIFVVSMRIQCMRFVFLLL